MINLVDLLTDVASGHPQSPKFLLIGLGAIAIQCTNSWHCRVVRYITAGYIYFSFINKNLYKIHFNQLLTSDLVDN